MTEPLPDDVIEAIAAQKKREELIIAIAHKIVRGSLYQFVKTLWPTVRPGVTFKDNWHIKLICEELEKVSHPELHSCERTKREVINVPPGSAKSLLVCVFWPCWVWLTKAWFQFIFVTYQKNLTLRDATTSHQLMETKEYQEFIDTTQLWDWDSSQNTKEFFKNTRGGHRISLSVDGAGTGYRANCLAGSTQVSTEYGPREIQDLCAMAKPPRVWAYDHATAKPVLRRILTKFKSYRSIGVLTTSHGSIETTDDHRFFTPGRGYTRAADLREGDTLYYQGPMAVPTVPPTGRSSVLRSKKKDFVSSFAFLLKELWTLLQPTKRQSPATLPYMQQSDGLDSRSQRTAVLLKAMRTIKESASQLLLSSLRGVFSAQRSAARLLLGRVLKPRASFSHAWYEQLQLQPRTRIPQALQVDSGLSSRARRRTMYPLPELGSTDSSSHRRRYSEQSSTQSNDTLQQLPYDAPQIENTAVSIPWTGSGHKVRTYDLEVEECHNYFAGGLLVHNCVTFDDPCNVPKRGFPTLEEVMLVNDWWDSRMGTRLNDPAEDTFLGIMQRLHELDLTGHLLARDKLMRDSGNEEWIPYRHINVPAEYDPDEPREYDPRRTKGESFFPSRFTQAVLNAYKITLGDYGYASQFQQDPFPAGGGIFNISKLKLWQFPGENRPAVHVKDRDGNTQILEILDLPTEMGFQCQSWDLSFKDLESSDPVCGQVWGFEDAKFWMLDMIMAQMGVTRSMSEIRAMTIKWPEAWAKYIEDKANGSAVVEMLQDCILGLEAVDPRGGKESRASAVVPFVDAGNVVLPHPSICSMTSELMLQVGRFPKGALDDGVDTLTQALCKMGLMQGDYLEAMTKNFHAFAMGYPG